jgi:hypothetical protein
MFRLDGEVFLLGTAIAAPLNATVEINKNCDDLPLISAGWNPRAAAGSSRTAAPIANSSVEASTSASGAYVCFRPIADIS